MSERIFPHTRIKGARLYERLSLLNSTVAPVEPQKGDIYGDPEAPNATNKRENAVTRHRNQQHFTKRIKLFLWRRWDQQFPHVTGQTPCLLQQVGVISSFWCFHSHRRPKILNTFLELFLSQSAAHYGTSRNLASDLAVKTN